MSLSIESVKSLVQIEREAESAIKEAKEKAAKIIEEAKMQAKQIAQQAEAGRYYEEFLDMEMKKIERKKREAKKESDRALEELEEKAGRNMDAAVSLVLKLVLGE